MTSIFRRGVFYIGIAFLPTPQAFAGVCRDMIDANRTDVISKRPSPSGSERVPSSTLTGYRRPPTKPIISGNRFHRCDWVAQFGLGTSDRMLSRRHLWFCSGAETDIKKIDPDGPYGCQCDLPGPAALGAGWRPAIAVLDTLLVITEWHLIQHRETQSSNIHIDRIVTC